MPFTLSHPVAAIPLKRLGFSLSGLVVGSMSPDFIYILKLAPKIGYTHTLPGLFTFCLPASWVVLWLYQMLKQPLASLVPGLVPEPVPAAAGRERLKRFGLTSLSILAGACTHIVWDGFTHETGWMVAYFPALNSTALNLGFDQVSLARLLHHVGSLFGGGWLALQIKRHLARTWALDDPVPCTGCSSLVPALTLLATSVGLGWLYAWIVLRPIIAYGQVREMMLRGLAGSGAALITLLLVYSLVWHVGRRMRPAEASNEPLD
jgi:hypothetical protein